MSITDYITPIALNLLVCICLCLAFVKAFQLISIAQAKKRKALPRDPMEMEMDTGAEKPEVTYNNCNLTGLMNGTVPIDPAAVYVVYYTSSNGIHQSYILTGTEYSEFVEMARKNTKYVDGKPKLDPDIQDEFFRARRDNYEFNKRRDAKEKRWSGRKNK